MLEGLAPAPIAGAFSLRQGDRQLPQPYEGADCDCKKNFEGNSETQTINKLFDRCQSKLVMSRNLRAAHLRTCVIMHPPVNIDQINSELRMNWLYPLAPLWTVDTPARRSGGSLPSRTPAFASKHRPDPSECPWLAGRLSRNAQCANARMSIFLDDTIATCGL